MTGMPPWACLPGLLAAMVRRATPILFAALGECLSERSGVLNLGIEGIMFTGALAAFLTAHVTGNLLLAVAAAFLSGAALALVHAALVVSLGVSQHVSGLGLTIFSSGLALFLYRLAVGTPATPPQVTPFSVCLLYTSDAADDLLCVDLGGRPIIKKKKTNTDLLSLP